MDLRLRLHHILFALAVLSVVSAGVFALLLHARAPRAAPGGQPSVASGTPLEKELRRAIDLRLRHRAEGERAARERRVVAGMGPDQVRQSWGEPHEVGARLREGRRLEVWVYERGGQRVTLVFDHGVVVNINSVGQ